MQRTLITLLALFLLAPLAHGGDGFVSLFDGKTLDGWEGDAKFWRVENGAIVGETTKDNPTKGNTFLVYTGGEVSDFVLEFDYRITPKNDKGFANSGVQYRSFRLNNAPDKFRLGGYQADFEAGDRYSGILYGEKFRGILADRGKKTVIQENGKPKTVGSVGDSKEIQKHIKKDGWNHYQITADGYAFTHKINGQTTIEATDADASDRRASGLLGIQVHQGPPMKVEVKNIRIKHLNKSAAKAGDGDKKKIVFVPGPKSHGYGSHEHRAGCLLLADQLNRSGLNLEAVVSEGFGYPKDTSVFDGADTVVVYCDGGGRHLLNDHIDEFDELMKKGVGLVCLHYGVETVKGKPGDHFLKWIGGYFETHWSVNPHWRANYSKLPDHPISRGVKPFEILDEWYYHMRFRQGMDGVTPILSDLPPESSLKRKDGSHSNNPHVRDAVLERKESQHTAWAYQRGGDYNHGRGFGFTGGHFHWNWGHNDMRRVVLNAIVWTAKMDVPKGGVPLQTVTAKDLEKNQDYKQPGNWKSKTIQDQIDQWNGTTTLLPKERVDVAAKKVDDPASESLFAKRVTPGTPGHAVDIDVDITGAKKLFLVVDDGGDGFGCDWADWAEPRLVGPDGAKKLTELKWFRAETGWGKVHINKRADGEQPLKIDGKTIAYGLGTHANSIIAYDLPDDHNYTRFKARAGLDNGGTDQGCGSTVHFSVYTDALPDDRKSSQSIAADYVPKDLFDLPDDLAVTLWAQSPLLSNPTNMDIDAQGRIWVAEGRNYRYRLRNKPLKYPEGDRIVVVQDTDGDGRADQSHTFVQDPELIAPLGVAVIGNKVVVSQPPHLIVYTDVDGDARFDPAVDTRENLLTGFKGLDHDHSLHSVTVGPDGRWYFNHGNMGSTFTDTSGREFFLGSPYNNKEVAGKPSADGHVYIGGAAFSMKPDGSDVQVIGHNFRNSYEQTVTSFGDVFQNDNDDPPACRTTWLMQYGNLGFASADGKRRWQADRRPGQPVPVAEWRQEDPGTIPAGDVYGGGAPTGIVFYENGALGEKYRGLLLSCESARNVVFGYLPQPAAAGFQLERFDFLNTNREKKFVGADFSKRDDKGELHTHFRPSDVAVGPDGAIYVADWFDPRVGGHQTRDDDAAGAIYRIARKGVDLSVPAFDLDSTAGRIRALRNPAPNVRALGFYALVQHADTDRAAVVELLRDDNPYIAARVVWVLANMGDSGLVEVEKLLSHDDPQMRIAAFRALRQANHRVVEHAAQLAGDSDSGVRRAAALAMRDVPFEKSRDILIKLAQGYDGHDRWYLEALGTGATGKEAKLYAALKPTLGPDPHTWSTAFARIAWRLHPVEAIDDLKTRALSGDVSKEQRELAIDALAFIDDKQAAQAVLTIAKQGPRDTFKHASWWVKHRHNNTWRPYDLAKQLPDEASPEPVVTVKTAEVATQLPPVEKIAALEGDAKRGKALFFGRAACMACHQVGGKGGQIGPDLTGTARAFDRKTLIQNLVDPAASIALGYETTNITLKNGQVVSGFVVADGDPVVVKQLTGIQQGIDADDIKKREKTEASMMPPAASLGLTAQNLADLATYLQSLAK